MTINIYFHENNSQEEELSDNKNDRNTCNKQLLIL